ncbi:hypothetical protein BDZ97DRAFT_721520 [Flammula alnicola]|nr:hypothetical protein BDZ97DRAFT_721520 [Flammula alnicola]
MWQVGSTKVGALAQARTIQNEESNLELTVEISLSFLPSQPRPSHPSQHQCLHSFPDQNHHHHRYQNHWLHHNLRRSPTTPGCHSS